jgi:predicted protein tyrosine phosphatase
MSTPLKILFVCGRNKRRSPTAEKIYAHDRRLAVRSVGLAETSKRRMVAADAQWADLILVMERKYVGRIKTTFRNLDTLPAIVSLDIPDEYIFMQRELIDLLQPAVESAIENYRAEQAAAAEESAS